MAKQQVTLLDHMGSDLAVVNAARVSFDKESEWAYTEDPHCEYCTCPEGDRCLIKHLSESDQKLISYLAKHNHWTPFAHTAISLRMKAPIFVRTQCFKHKAGFVENEVSRRYVDSEPEFFEPDGWRKRSTDGAKQGSSDEVLWQKSLYYRQLVQDAKDTYEFMVENGVAPEQARMVLPQSMMTEWVWTGNLASYARFCKQRLNPHAQKEIQELAQMVSDVIEPLFPVSWKALREQ